MAGKANSVKQFLEEQRNRWHDWNIPYADGEALYQLVTENNFKSVLEIGTSTGHSTIWLAYAIQQTGGMVTTIENNKDRYKKAVRNFEFAGVSQLIDARFGEALHVIQTLDKAFDFIFSDATLISQPKDSYLLFFKATDHLLKAGGIYTMHNVTDGFGDNGSFFRYLEKMGGYKTSIIQTSPAGISVSRKLTKYDNNK